MNANASQSVAVIVAHPDDEVLAFGGTIARHASKGEKVHILILATGLTARGEQNEEALAALKKQAEDAAAILGAEVPEFADFPDNRMDTAALLDVVQRIELFIERHQPGLVFTHHAGDLNIDHRITAQAVLTAVRPLPGRKPMRLYAGEVLSSSEYAEPSDRYTPNTYVDIEPWLETKKQALSSYTSERRDWPHPRSVEAIEHQARLRGSEAGMNAAEALYLVRAVIQ